VTVQFFQRHEHHAASVTAELLVGLGLGLYTTLLTITWL